ncbi:amphi-Trp domain-containing protein [Halomarina halobia]|uniref:Amphi-Trp domain-containing protein n=1 Tax=Halomarina halobia TaxID=3033386 RepID=A0ABD6A834_9EURY|nr:amphi-Trp domain-containing protein [Halomarina sp. PSR21]
MSKIDAEREMSRAEVAAYLREFANRLDGGGSAGMGGAEADRTRTAGSADTGGATSDAGGTPTVTGTDDATRSPESERAGDASRSEGRTGEGGRSAASEKVTIVVGNDSATVNPPETVDFAVEVSGSDPVLGAGRQGVEFGIYWRGDQVEEDDEISIK